MDLEEIRNRLEKIKNKKNDPECAHDFENKLLKDFIKHVAESGISHLSTHAKEVLKVDEIDFPRWRA